MKTGKFKSFTTTLALVASMSFSSLVHAEDIVIPVVSKPAVLQEGTQRELSDAQIAELLPWAKNSKVFLTDLIDSLQGLSATDQVDRLVNGIKTVVTESAPKNSEMLMRYALNRSLVLSETLSSELDSNSVGTVDAKLRVLKLSVHMALKYYDSDLAVMSKKQSVAFADFGKQYFVFLNELNKSIFDASAQYAIQRTSLEWLQWDLYRDLNNAKYAPQIVKINNGLKIYPAKNQSDAQAISQIRQLKQLIAGIELDGIKISKATVSSNAQNIYISEKPDYSSPNFKECYRLKAKSLYAEQASSECFEIIKKTEFNFKNESFKKCYELYAKSVYSHDAVDSCVNEIIESQFDYTDSNFLSCHEKKAQSLYSSEAAGQCVNDINKNPSLNFSESNFVSCYEKMKKSIYSSDAVDQCITKVKFGVSFNSKNFEACHTKLSKSLYSSDALNICTDYIRKSGFDFLDSNFESCYRLKEKSMYSSDAVESCVKELK